MQSAPPPLTRDLLLIGGGHAHALVLRAWGMDPQPGTRVTLINPGPTAPYTGMLPGHVAGHYTRAELDIDLVRLGRFAGAQVIDGKVDAIETGRAHVDGRGWVPFDVASIDIGIHAEMPEIPGFAAHAVGAKPLDRFATAWRAHREAAAAGAPGDTAVIGGGVAGAELALAMAHALRDTGARITLIERAPALTGVSDRVRARLMRALSDTGVAVHFEAEVIEIQPHQIVLKQGVVPSHFTTGAAGARPHPWLAQSDLPLENGFIKVDPQLRVLGRETLFGAGDCIHMAHAPRPKAGVFAVRQAPVLHHNLRAALAGRPLRAYRPQRSYLKLISLGAQSAVAQKGPLALSAPWLWRLKDKIDRDFMTRLTDLPQMRQVPPRDRAMGADDLAKPLCGGCGAKVGGGALAAALQPLAPPLRPDILSRPGDDAAILAHGTGRQVFTTDHLRGFTEDLTLMARIATVHALGDIWAMGAVPQAAVAQIILPRQSDSLARRRLDEILPAMQAVLRGSGAELVGGHTSQGSELTLGLSMTGLVDAPIGVAGARVGDDLVLTRPLGTGVVLAAEMALAAPGQVVLDTLHAMAQPQGEAAKILSKAHAMTDVTGFGLAGHLANICDSSGVSGEIYVEKVPIYEGARDLAEQGHRSSLWQANRSALPNLTGQGARFDLLFDPQTAGGLLAAIDPSETQGVLASLKAAGHPAAHIGKIAEGAGLRLVWDQGDGL